ncbi:MAG TPA: DUF3899 domain-containing protein [Haloplasmataceae bacterium]
MKRKTSYLITTGVGLIFVIIILLSKNIFAQDDLKTIFHIITDAFFSVGIIIFGFGLLLFSSNSGTFDMLSYGFKKLVDVFRKDLSNVKYKTFYDYKVSKQEKKLPFLFLVNVGLIFILIACLFLWLYYKQ